MEDVAEATTAATTAEIRNAERKRYATAAAAEMEERVEARVGEAPAADVEDPEVPRGCENAMMRICPPYPFGTGKTCILSWQG